LDEFQQALNRMDSSFAAIAAQHRVTPQQIADHCHSRQALEAFLREAPLCYSDSHHFDTLVLCLLQAEGRLPPVVLDDATDSRANAFNIFLKSVGCTGAQCCNIVKRLRYCKLNGVRQADGRTLDFDPEPFGASLVHLLFEMDSMAGQKNSDTGYLNPDYKLLICNVFARCVPLRLIFAAARGASQNLLSKLNCFEHFFDSKMSKKLQERCEILASSSHEVDASSIASLVSTVSFMDISAALCSKKVEVAVTLFRFLLNVEQCRFISSQAKICF